MGTTAIRVMLITIALVCLEAQKAATQTDRRCAAGDVLLTYITSDTMLSICARTQDSARVTTHALNVIFWNHVHAFRTKLASADPLGYIRLGKILYLFLIKPVDDLFFGKNRLIIQRDEGLSGIPFEALVMIESSEDLKGGIPYLVNDFVVEYCSMNDHSLVVDEPAPLIPGHPRHHEMYAFLGFSPDFSNHPCVSPLPGSKVEIEEIARLFRDHGLASWQVSGKYSGKEAFMAAASSGKILHLATHFLGQESGQQEPGFLCWDFDFVGEGAARGPGLLTAEDIEGLKLDADLVVLNACATGRHFTTIRGRQSIPEVFLKAGARNILSTLWNITDHLAKRFMVDFYRFLLSGKSVGESLREVKLRMIHTPETSLPAVWAPYVLTRR